MLDDFLSFDRVGLALKCVGYTRKSRLCYYLSAGFRDGQGKICRGIFIIFGQQRSSRLDGTGASVYLPVIVMCLPEFNGISQILMRNKQIMIIRSLRCFSDPTVPLNSHIYKMIHQQIYLRSKRSLVIAVGQVLVEHQLYCGFHP